MKAENYRSELESLYIELEKVENMSELEACEFCGSDSKEDALEKMYKLHPELTKACINHTLETGEDLDFSLI